MQNSFSSPNVTANEVDQSFVEPGAPTPSTLLVGSSPKGPAFVPVQINSWDEFVTRFGDLNPDHPTTYAARYQLQNSNALLMMRVLGHDDGLSTTNGYIVGGVTGISDTSGSTSTTGSVLAVVHHSGTINVITVAGVANDANRFVFRVGSVFAATASFLTSSNDYIGKVLNTDPTLYNTYGHYLAELYRYQRPAASASWWAVGVSSASFNDFTANYTVGETTWVKSQPLGGMEFDLLKIYTRSAGRATNDEVKVTIANVKPSANPTIYPFGTFDIQVRKFDDSDVRPVVLESFSQLTFDPSDPNYVLRRVGDIDEQFDTTQRKFIVVEGSFPNRSRYIRVKLNQDANFPAESLPWGFRGYPKLLFSGSSTAGTGANKVPDLQYTAFQRDLQGNFNANVSWGVSFVSGGVADRMRAFPDSLVSHLTASDADFSLKSLVSYYENGVQRYVYVQASSSYSPIFASGSVQRFTLPFRGGFDGWDLRVSSPIGPFTLTNEADETNIGVVSLKRAVDAVSNPDIVQYDVMAMPGVHNKKAADYARTLANERKDFLYIMDITGSTRSDAINNLTNREIDDNYVAAYYPDVKVNDRVNNRIVRLPPSAVVVGTLAFTDRVSQPFFAPAGFNRGGLAQFDVVDTVDRLDFKDRDALYETGRINPIGKFAREGIVVFGQKTLQLRSSALDRVNVRRLLIFAKKAVVREAKDLLFEPNNSATWQRFVSRVNPILERIKQAQGLQRFKVVFDSTTTTPDLVDRNAMYGKILLEPTKAAEFITIDFVITSAGVTFTA
jgi:hypothetical protein